MWPCRLVLHRKVPAFVVMHHKTTNLLAVQFITGSMIMLENSLNDDAVDKKATGDKGCQG